MSEEEKIYEFQITQKISSKSRTPSLKLPKSQQFDETKKIVQKVKLRTVTKCESPKKPTLKFSEFLLIFFKACILHPISFIFQLLGAVILIKVLLLKLLIFHLLYLRFIRKIYLIIKSIVYTIRPRKIAWKYIMTPYLNFHKNYTLVLDMDETLIHTSSSDSMINSEWVSTSRTDSKEGFYFSKRPYLEQFLEHVSRFFKIVVFTASQKEYADEIIKRINKDNCISEVYYRDSCIKTDEGWIKDLKTVQLDLSKVIMIDNSQISFKLNKENGMLIKGFFGEDEDDKELLQFMQTLTFLYYKEGDIRVWIKKLNKTK